MPSQKKRPVTLTPQDREDLVQITTTGVHGASQIMRARVLLALDTSVGTVDDEVVIAVRRRPHQTPPPIPQELTATLY